MLIIFNISCDKFGKSKFIYLFKNKKGDVSQLTLSDMQLYDITAINIFGKQIISSCSYMDINKPAT